MKSILKLHPAWLMLIACCFLQAGCTGILYNCAGIFFPPVCAELGFGVGELSFYMTMRGIFMMLLLPLAGRLLVRTNLRILLSVSVLGATLAVASMAFFTKLFQWYIAGAFIGIFGSFIFLLPAPIIIGNWFAKKSGIATGIAMACSGLGGAVMNPVGSYIIAHWGWRTAYLVLAGVCLLLVLPFTLFVVRFQPSDIGVLPYGATETVASSQTGERVASGYSVSQAVRSPLFPLILLLGGCIGFSMTYCQHFPAYAASIGWPAGIGAAMTSMSMVGNISGKLGMGWLNDRIGVKRSTLLGLGLVILSFLALMSFTNAPVFAVGAALLAGVSMSLTSVSMPLVVRGVFGSRNFGVIFSYVSMGVSLFSSAGTSIVGYLYDSFGNYRFAFLVGVGICAAAIGALYLLFYLAEKRTAALANA